jgi:hypothetical protein
VHELEEVPLCVFNNCTIERGILTRDLEVGVGLEVLRLCRGLDLDLYLEKVLSLFPLLAVDLRLIRARVRCVVLLSFSTHDGVRTNGGEISPSKRILPFVKTGTPLA